MRSTFTIEQRQGHQEDHVRVPRHRRVSGNEALVISLGGAKVPALADELSNGPVGAPSPKGGVVEIAIGEVARLGLRPGRHHRHRHDGRAVYERALLVSGSSRSMARHKDDSERPKARRTLVWDAGRQRRRPPIGRHQRRPGLGAAKSSGVSGYVAPLKDVRWMRNGGRAGLPHGFLEDQKRHSWVAKKIQLSTASSARKHPKTPCIGRW